MSMTIQQVESVRHRETAGTPEAAATTAGTRAAGMKTAGMKTAFPSSRAAVQDHPTLRFASALDQLKEEHEALRSRLQEFSAIDEIIRSGKPNTDWYGTLRDLKKRVEGFLELLTRHANWEDQALFPTVAIYTEDHTVIDVLEEDHLLAVQYMEGFLNELRRSISPIHQSRAIRIIELLMNAYWLLLDHFRAEEQYVYPIAEDILEDIDYLSC